MSKYNMDELEAVLEVITGEDRLSIRVLEDENAIGVIVKCEDKERRKKLHEIFNPGYRDYLDTDRV